MKIASITLFSLVQFIQVATWCSDTDKLLLAGWKGYSGALYKQFSEALQTNDKSYNGWEMYCQTYGGNLTTAKTAAENDFVYSLLTHSRGYAYIGLKTDGFKWIWNDGSPVIYSNWSAGPNIKYIQAECAIVYIQRWWNPHSCYTPRSDCVCKCPIGLNSSCNISTGCNDPYAECKAIISGANSTCQCKRNYTDVGGICKAGLGLSCITSSGCSDPHAECKETTSLGNSSCQCKNNYTDVGRICMRKADLNSSCNISTGCIDPYAECNANTSGSNNTCQCASNYTDVGGICKAGLDLPCSPSSGCRDPFAECKANISGANYTCQCRSNYTDAGGMCKAGLDLPCSPTSGCRDPFAECKANISGANYTCQCRSNYTDAGGMCKAGLDLPCSPSSGCRDPFAECKTNISGANYTCQCRSNYTDARGMCKAVIVDSINITGDTYNGTAVNITCFATIFGNVTPTFNWKYGVNVINPVDGYRIRIFDNRISHHMHITLLFNPIQSSDTGTYECSVADQNSPPSSMNISVYVLPQPTVSIQPLTQAIYAGATVNITCKVENNVSITRMVWYRNGTNFNAATTLPDESLSNTATTYILTRRNIANGTVYECQGENDAGSGDKRQSNIYVILPGAVTCNNEIDGRGTHWARTLIGTYDKQICPTGLSGDAVRYCSHDGVWRNASYDNCVNETLLQLLILTDNMKNGLPLNTLSNTLVQLTSITNISDVYVDLQKRAVEIVTDVLNNAIQISNNNNNITRSDLENFLEVASNMLDVKNAPSWKTIIDEGKDGASTIFRSVEQFGSIKARLTPSDNESVIINKPNLFVNIVSMPLSDINFTDPTANGPFMERDLRSRLFLSKAALEKGNYTYYVAAYFRNVSQIVHTNVFYNNATLNATYGPEMNSDVISLQLDPLPVSLSQPIILTFKHLSDNYSNPVCSFLRYKDNGYRKEAWLSDGCTLVSTSADTTLCECNHLTNFAILMSPGRAPSKDQVPLSIISSIGCAISIFCLSVTMIIHTIVWRYVKSGRTCILMNLCLALIISYSIFLAGADRTENKYICLAVAALLHYFYLVVFFLMLAFGIEIAVSVVHLFASKSRVRWLLPLAWVLPAVTVGISLGLTKLNGYGNANFCWLSVDDGLIWAFVGPAALVMLVNFIIIIVVFKVMFSTSVMVTKSNKEKAKTSFRSLCVLLPITGLTWVFGILSVNEDMVIFQFLFAILNSLQGFFIFLFHCVFNHQLKNALKQINDKRKRRQINSSIPAKCNSSGTPPNQSNSLDEQQVHSAPELEGSKQNIGMCTREMRNNINYKHGSGRNIEDRSPVLGSNMAVDGKISNILQQKENSNRIKRTDTDITLLAVDSSTSIVDTEGINSFRPHDPSNECDLTSTKMSTDVTTAKKQRKPNKHLQDYQNPAFDESFQNPKI